MNYLAHARHLLAADADPYEVAGVAVPDWLGVADRRTKCRSRDATRFQDDPDPRVAAIARGVVRHHADDAWFHESPAFGRLSLDFAKRFRVHLGEATSMRPWFLGHILVELLLDDELSTRRPDALERYYELVASVDAELVADTVRRMSGRDPGRLAEFIGRFVEAQFLRDYRDDARLTHRLSQVMQRVGLDPLPEAFVELLPECRAAVAEDYASLIDSADESPAPAQTDGQPRA